MNEELDKEIERVKKKLKDYIELANKFNYPQKVIQKQVDLMLDDLSKLMKKRK